MGGKMRVGLVYGGRSGEHEVSLSTAFSVLKEFDYGKYEILPYYITKKGVWRAGPVMTAPPASKEQLTFEGDAAEAATAGGAKPGNAPAAASADALRPLFLRMQGGDAAPDGRPIDVMFPLLHGTYGEDGTIQGLFEMAGLPYVGCGVLASAVGMDKVLMKTVFAQAGLPQVAYRHFTRHEWEKDPEARIAEAEELGYPCFVKPANLGSSVGITKARSRNELKAAIEEALRYDRKVIIEEFVDAREIEVSVLGNDEPRASVPGEIRSLNEFYDYTAKYTDGKSVLEIPAKITPEQAEAVREMAVRAFRAIDGSGLCRADFFLRKSDGALLINEVNTMPGFTPYSMYPLLWKESGLSYRELLDELIRLALERFAEKQSLQY